MNNLDPEVAEWPEKLVVYGGIGKAARNWESFDAIVETLDEAIVLAEEAKKEGRGLSIGLLGNAAEILPEMIKRNFIPDIITDQTSAHDPLNGYLPAGMSLEEGATPS